MAYTPYRKIAQTALMNWYSLGEEEAFEMATKNSVEFLETKACEWGIGAKNSINAAINKFAEGLGLTEQEKADLTEVIYGTDEAAELSEKNIQTLKTIREKAKELESAEEFMLDVLFAVHDDWVDRNAKNFVNPKRVGKKYQHLKSELIGWKEQKADLVFAEPIAEALGIKVDEVKLEKAYNQRVRAFVRGKNIGTKENLIEYILKADYEHLSDVNKPQTREDAELMATQARSRIFSAFVKTTGDDGRPQN